MITLKWRIKGVNESWKTVNCNSRNEAVNKMIELQFGQTHELEFETE